MGLPGEELVLLLKYVPSIALSHFRLVLSFYKETNLTASSKCGKQPSLPNAKDVFFSTFMRSPAPKSLSCSAHGKKPTPGMTEGLF